MIGLADLLISQGKNEIRKKTMHTPRYDGLLDINIYFHGHGE